MFYLKLKDKNYCDIQLQHPPIGLPRISTDFLQSVVSQRYPFWYSVFMKVKSIFPPGVASSLAVNTIDEETLSDERCTRITNKT